MFRDSMQKKQKSVNPKKFSKGKNSVKEKISERHKQQGD